MLKLETSLSDIAQFLKKKDNLDLGKFLDELTGKFITAGTIVSILVSADPVTTIACLATGASISALKPSRLFGLLHDKFNYIDKGRELSAIERYEKLSYINMCVLHIAANQAIKEIYVPEIEKHIKKLKLSDSEKNELGNFSKEKDKAILEIYFQLSSQSIDEALVSYLKNFFEPLEQILDKCIANSGRVKESKDICNKLSERAKFIYNAFIVNLSAEFPEFAIWADVSCKEQIMQYFNHILKSLEDLKQEQQPLEEEKKLVDRIQELAEQIEKLQSNKYKEEFGFENLIQDQKEFIKRQTDDIKEFLTHDYWLDITTHHEYIRKHVVKSISENKDVDDIIYPSNGEIYIPQGFKLLRYYKARHGREVLMPKFWESENLDIKQGENIANQLLSSLIDPANSFRPIVILGHPGAGKSMLSSIFAARLCDSTEFVPFLIKLRDVDSSSLEVNEHINKGIKKSGIYTSEVNWLKWSKLVPQKIPVIILDGFDELIQTSPKELNGYLVKIKQLQENAIDGGICIRVIITSRLAIMQDVEISDSTTIIKLDSFDAKRQKFWIRKWNNIQTNSAFKEFKIPENPNIQELAKEPLLLFMLANYDFEGSDLQKAANDKDFNQSKLYDKLFNKFTLRQLKKEEGFIDLDKDDKKKEEDLFRLRLGLVALMMFLQDKTCHSASELDKELKQFDLSGANVKPKKIFSGFFFIHENISTDESENKTFNFEFMHKTFGEFLAADFLLRVALLKTENYKKFSKPGVFRFCYGYNWLHKHPKIVSFLLEHMAEVIHDDKKLYIEEFIKEELKAVFDTNSLPFPTNDITVLNPLPVLEHLAIYSQNLVLLWLAINKQQDFAFDLYEIENFPGNITNEPDFNVTKDRGEYNKNKLIWKRLAALWTMAGNTAATANLGQWLLLEERENEILLKLKSGEVKHYFHEAAKISCNDYNLLMSFYTTDFVVEDVKRILKRKPDYAKVIYDLIYSRFDYIINTDRENLYSWLYGMLKGREELLLSHALAIKSIKQHSFDFGSKVASLLTIHKNISKLLPVDKLKSLEQFLQYFIVYEPENLLDEYLNFDLEKDFLQNEQINLAEFICLHFIKSPSIEKTFFEIYYNIQKTKSFTLRTKLRLIELMCEHFPKKDLIEQTLNDIYNESKDFELFLFSDMLKLAELMYKYLPDEVMTAKFIIKICSSHSTYARKGFLPEDHLRLAEILSLYSSEKSFLSNVYGRSKKDENLPLHSRLQLAELICSSSDFETIKKVLFKIYQDTNQGKRLLPSEKFRLQNMIDKYGLTMKVHSINIKPKNKKQISNSKGKD